MADDKTVPELDSAVTLDGTELMYAVQGGLDVKFTSAQLQSFIASYLSQFFDGGNASSVYAPSNRNIDGGGA